MSHGKESFGRLPAQNPHMKERRLTPAELVRNAQRANGSGTDLLTMGLSVGALGVAGAALGAVCPVCVVATPALLGFGLIQKLRAFWIRRRATTTEQTSP